MSTVLRDQEAAKSSICLLVGAKIKEPVSTFGARRNQVLQLRMPTALPSHQSTLAHSHRTVHSQQCYLGRSLAYRQWRTEQEISITEINTIKEHPILEGIQENHLILKEATHSIDGRIYS